MDWFQPTELKFDISKIESMRSKITQISMELTNLKIETMAAVVNLKTKWVTPAGIKYMKSIDTEWGTQVDKYVKMLEAVDELLAAAENEYRKVEDKVDLVKF